MNELLEKIKQETANEIYSLPYSFLDDSQKLTICDLIAFNFGKEITEKARNIINS